MSESNSTDSSFVGAIPFNYDKYFVPLIFEDYAADMAKRVSSSSAESVLEIGAGTGVVTRHLRDLLPQDVRITATDLNDAMLDLAKEKFVADDNIEFRQANAMSLPFADSSFDAVVCQFSIMFFPDKLEASREVARVLKPGGKYYFNVWDSYEHNHVAGTVQEAIASLYPNDPPRFYDLPYGYFQIDPIKTMLGEAGFGEINIAVLPRDSVSESSRHVAYAMTLGSPMYSQLVERPDHTTDHILDVVDQAVANAHGASPVKAKMQGIVFEATSLS